MRISWHLQTITLLVIFASRKPLALCQYTKPCSFNQMCTCKTEQTRTDVTCQRVPFYKLPDLLPEQYTHIDIMMSDLETIENDAFGLAQIESIRLMNNQIMLVGNRAFSSVENTLRSLDLSYNKLTNFPHKALHSVNHLDWLNLQGNEISTLSSENDDFFNTWSRIKQTLQTLYIGDNDIINISHNVFAQYERLTWLNIDSNKLSVLAAQNLPPSLRTLSYCQNYVQNFPIDIVDTLPNLTRFYIRGNYIRRLPLRLLRNPKRMDKLDLGENSIELVEYSGNTHTFIVRDLHLDFNRIRTLPAYAFRGIGIARLYLARNGLQFINDKAFADLSNSLEYLDMEHNNLEEIPSALAALTRLKYLYLSSNKISNVSQQVFENYCSTIKAISLAGNQLMRIPKMALRKCNSLSHLNLGYNYIHEINEQDFSEWANNLDTLLLRNNRISEIEAHAFRRTPKLRELSLSFNKITSLHERSFVDVKNSLETLEISFGLFRDEIFTGDFLKPLTYLLWLALDNNNINAMVHNAFYPLQNLQYLNLDTNALIELPVGLFSSRVHKYLKDVRLSNNYLTTLRTKTFVDLNELQNVIMGQNQLRKIENASFCNLPNLMNVVLSGNQISKIEPHSFINLPNLLMLDLQYNALDTLNLYIFNNVSGESKSLSLNVSHNELHRIEVDNDKTTLYLTHVDISVNNLLNIPHRLLEFCRNSIARLDLNYNRVSKINENAFRNLTTLEYLSIKSNVVYFVHKKAFVNLNHLQILDLSENRIEYLSSETFNSIRALRVLNLSRNNLRTLARDLFTNTVLENLDLSNNLLNVMPAFSISEVGETLRKLDLSNNHIDHLDSTMFSDVPKLSSLNLSSNKLNILPDNVFTSIGNLLTLDISSNPLRANFKELFHYVQKLRSLNLAETSLSDVPHLPLPNLVTLRLSMNRIENLSSASVDNLFQLRRLYLDSNRFKSLPSGVWNHLPLLKELDVSKNPIKILSKDSFFKLTRLQTLNIQYLNNLERFDVDSFSHNKILTNVKVDTIPRVDKNCIHLGCILSTVPSLRTVSVRVLEEKLDDQLTGTFHSKLKELEITGASLKYIGRGALKGIENTYDLMLRIRNTLIEDFPVGLFEGIQNIAHLSLDFSNNRLLSLSPAVLYSNITSWENVGTKLLDGGLILKDNPWSCDCGLVWLGHWLRRWLRETIEIHTLIIKEAQHMENMAREATCLDQRTNRRIPIIDLHPEDLSCQASALSGDGSTSHLLGNHLIGCLIKTISVIGFTRYLWSI